MPTILCRHIRPSGRRCQAPALRNRPFCYHHESTNAHLRTLHSPDDGTHNILHPLTPLEITRIQREPLVAEYYSRTRGPLELNLPPLEDAHSVQLALSMVLFALGQNRIDLKRAAAILYTLQIAATNVRSLPADEPNSVRDIVTDETGAVLAPEDPEDPEGPEENQAHPTHADTSQSAFAAQLDAELDAEEQADDEAWLQQQAEEQAREAAWQHFQAQERADAATSNTTPVSLNAAADPEPPSTPYSLLPAPPPNSFHPTGHLLSATGHPTPWKVSHSARPHSRSLTTP